MKKLCIAMLIILSICLLVAGCDVITEDKTISASGDLAYFAEMGTDLLKEKCQGNYIEVSGTVDTVYHNIGTLYIGNSLKDNIRFSCDLDNTSDGANISKGDFITIRGKCTSCIGSSVYLYNCEVVKYNSEVEITSTGEPITGATTIAETSSTIPPTEAPHTHNFSAATCTEPKTCSCGATEGEANGHTWQAATCTTKKICLACGETTGSLAAHQYSNGKCTVCNSLDPYDPNNITVWIPTNGGSKYHSRSSCSGMKNPQQVTLAQAKASGYTACSKCN